MNFETEHRKFLDYHLSKRKGERRGRLERGHGHGEQLFARHVWWPLRGNFDHLHPEYEVLDWRGKPYFADFVWIVGLLRLIIEIKGYNPHVKDMDRQGYCNELNRETFLTAVGYQVISFSYDDVRDRPELCIMLLKMVMNRFLSEQAPLSPAQLVDKEIIRYAIRMAEPIRPKDVQDYFSMDPKTVKGKLEALCQQGWLKPLHRGNRIRHVRYELAKDVLHYL